MALLHSSTFMVPSSEPKSTVKPHSFTSQPRLLALPLCHTSQLCIQAMSSRSGCLALPASTAQWHCFIVPPHVPINGDPIERLPASPDRLPKIKEQASKSPCAWKIIWYHSTTTPGNFDAKTNPRPRWTPIGNTFHERAWLMRRATSVIT